MGNLIAIVGPSGVGKTTLLRALVASVAELPQQRPFNVGLESHAERPFQALFKQDARYALANQLDYLLYRAEQERALRADPRTALTDGGLDMDFHGFTRLFHANGWLSDPELDLCRRFHAHTRSLLPPPELIVTLSASRRAISDRLAARNRINIASEKDAGALETFVAEWLAEVPESQILRLDVTDEDASYSRSVAAIRARISSLG
jgi:deoxyadenosine/deoxycytidine kinase